jgi:hypothetical protein
MLAVIDCAGLFNLEWTRIDANKGITFAVIGVYSWFIIVFSLGRGLPDLTQSSVGPPIDKFKITPLSKRLYRAEISQGALAREISRLIVIGYAQPGETPP